MRRILEYSLSIDIIQSTVASPQKWTIRKVPPKAHKVKAKRIHWSWSDIHKESRVGETGAPGLHTERHICLVWGSNLGPSPEFPQGD